MPYDTALENSWASLEKSARDKIYSVQFLADEYTVDINDRKVLSLSCNVPAKDYLTIIILHYLSRKLKKLPKVEGEWIAFTQLSGGQGYYPTFKKRVIDRILAKYGSHPEALLEAIERFKAKRMQVADIGIVIEAFEGVPVFITLWRKDEEFAAELNIHFDKSIADILCTEDIVVMSEFIASKI